LVKSSALPAIAALFEFNLKFKPNKNSFHGFQWNLFYLPDQSADATLGGGGGGIYTLRVYKNATEHLSYHKSDQNDIAFIYLRRLRNPKL